MTGRSVNWLHFAIQV